MINVFGFDKKYSGSAIKEALALADGFPLQLNPVGKSSLPIPVVGFPNGPSNLTLLFRWQPMDAE